MCLHLEQFGNHPDAEDAARALFCAAWMHPPQHRTSPKFGPWVAQYLSRQRARFSSAAQEYPALDAAVDLEDPSEIVQRRAAGGAIVAAVDALPSTQRTIVDMHFFQGRGMTEIARLLGSSAAEVRIQLDSACRAMAERLAAWQ